MLTGLLQPSSGQILFDDRPIGDDLTGFTGGSDTSPRNRTSTRFCSGRE